MDIRKILMISKLVLVVILAYTLVIAIFAPTDFASIKAPASAVASSRSESGNSDNHSNLSAEDYAKIVQKNPFDGSTRLIAWVHPEGSDSQVFDSSVSTELGLALVGTVSGSPIVARAIIKDLKTGVSELCKTGQIIGNCRIQSINPDSVTLLYDGREKTLRLNSGYAGQGPPSQESFTPVSRSSQAVQPQSSFQGQMPPIETILEKAIIRPHIINGQVEGLRITGLENIEGAEAFGLKNGDVIRSLNEHKLTSKQQAYQAVKKARTQDAISLELLRNNRTKELSFSIK